MRTTAGPALVLGGGSNLVVGDAGFDGTVLRVITAGIDVASAAGGGGGLVRHVTVAGRSPGTTLVARASPTAGRASSACRASPASSGATPIQNVGAYGQEVGETIVDACACSSARPGAASELDARGVRLRATATAASSADQGRLRRRSRVHVALRAGERPPIRYAELARALGDRAGGRAPLAAGPRDGHRLRRGKCMVLDPDDADSRAPARSSRTPSARAVAAARARAGALPVFPGRRPRQDSAAWLIERAGFRGDGARPRLAISSKHALALTNRGGATTAELVALARLIRDGVRARFDVVLENEPVFVGVAWVG